MTKTIELLEAIGKDASLRHASGEDLSQVLTGLNASEGLKLAAMSGDGGHLIRELGQRDNKAPNHVNNNVGGGYDHDHDDSHEIDDSDDTGADVAGNAA